MTITEPSPSDLNRPSLELGIEVRPVTGHIGAEIFGVDLSQPLASDVIAEIRQTLLRWKVVFFRDQDITAEQQIAFGQQFGEITPAHPTLPGLADHPEVLSLDSSLFRSVKEALAATGDKGEAIAKLGEYVDSGWHTDVTFVHNPPLGSILRGVVVPPYGGDTTWSNLVVAYEHLSPAVRDFVDGLQARHTNVLFTDPNGIFAEYKDAFEAMQYETIHPVVRVHPETGEKSLYVSPGFTRSIEGLTAKESDAVLKLLFEQIAKPAYTVRFRWQPNSIAFWDNRATAHLGPGDLAHLAFDRTVQRITIAGDVPVGPDGFESISVSGSDFT